MLRLAGDAGASVKTPADYEEAARTSLRDVVLPQWLGLLPLAGALLERAEGSVHVDGYTDVQWDFRTPVRLSAVPPSRPAAGRSMVVYPSYPSYVRPNPPPVQRHLTPTKVPSAATLPDADYMAIFEVTTKDKWSQLGRDDLSLLWRLEERLVVSLERAKALKVVGAAPLDITDVVAVVGVVGVFSCKESVSTLMARRRGRSAAPPLLCKLMDQARFVFVYQHYGDPSEGGSSPSGGGAGGVRGGAGGSSPSGGSAGVRGGTT